MSALLNLFVKELSLTAVETKIRESEWALKILVVAVHIVKRVRLTKTKHAAAANGDIKRANETSQKQNAKLKSAVSIKVITHVPIVAVSYHAILSKNFTKRNHTNTKSTKRQSSLFKRAVTASS